MKVIISEKAPKALGSYSHGFIVNDIIYTSGQIPLVSETNELVSEMKEATNLVLKNLLSIVEAGGGNKNSIAKVDIYVKDLNDFGIFNEEYTKFFGNHKPARVTTEVSNLPANAILEMSMIAEVVNK